MKIIHSRTIREFSYEPNLWPVVEGWATENGFVLQNQETSRHLYRKGRLLLLGPVMLEITQEGDTVTLQSWIKADLYLLMARFTGKPAEVGIQSGGDMTAWIPRMKARKAVNQLLVKLGQEPVV